MIKALFITCCIALLIVTSIFVAGGLDHRKSENVVKEKTTFENKISVPMHFSKMTGFEKPNTKPFHDYISEK